MSTDSFQPAVGADADEGPVDPSLRVVPADIFDVDPPYDPEDVEFAPGEFEDRFLDRELSWLRFNQRVLELAEDETVPLLERTRFLAIFTSNLDEFFMVRVAGLKRRIAAGVAVRAASGLMPREVLDQIWDKSADLMSRHARAFSEEIIPALKQEHIELVRWDALDRDEQKYCKRLFKERIFPVLTPLAVDPAHPFPYISGLSLNLAVLVRNPKTDKEHFARVKVPPIFNRFVSLGNHKAWAIFLADRIYLRHYRPRNCRVWYYRVPKNIAAPATSSEPPPPARVGRLDTLPRCRREAAKLYSDARKGVLPAGDASKLAAVLALVSTLIERGELEARLNELERRCA